ncbi:aryl hydrocarbon receptor repressor [Ctenodactylus gundi]
MPNMSTCPTDSLFLKPTCPQTLPGTGTQGMLRASGLAPFRNPPGQGSLEDRPPRAQRFTNGGYFSEDAMPASLPGPPSSPCNPMLPLEVPIKMESDSGSEVTAESYSPNQPWLGASNITKRHLVTFPTRMHLKTEPDCRHPVYTTHLRLGMLGAPLHSRATAGPCRELAPFYPTHSTCLEPGSSHSVCTMGHSEGQHPALGCDCRAPGAMPVIKQEPLDSPPWAALGPRAVPGMFPRSASASLIPPRACEAPFLP